ncbi:hypothetical protein AU476_31340 [Cupriavidus sp. UYMSc13B]|nr:hypothetical protein AU476_01320 [Cupriavidus sp. UYMSc13B]RWA48972.1 hypothetical protein AU476_31340 [Cupriavidus sp. UYMSc13B]
MNTNNPIHQSAALRGQRRFQEAIDLIERSLPTLDPDLHEIAYLEAFKAAKEAGDADLTRAYARKVAALDPGVPSIQDWL